jgi:hypothetical protein
MTAKWRPLLEGEHAVQALTIAKDVADAITRGEGEAPEGLSPEVIENWHHNLSSGGTGYSLLHAYLFWSGAGEEHADRAIEHLDRATDFIASVRTSESLYDGFPGIGWVTAHLSGRLFETDPLDGVDVDEALIRFLGHPSLPGEYDLVNGLVGLGVYALERLPRPSASRCLEKVVSCLAQRALKSEEGAAFFTPAEELLPIYRLTYPRGAFNLGVAHGLPGVIAMLGSTCRAGVATQQARPLLAATVSWLLAREFPPGHDCRFPHFHALGHEYSPSRLAWCYGDLGIAIALLTAARGIGDAALEREALRIARDAAGRDPSRSRIVDAGLCHGAAGAGHLFNRLYQATGDEQFAEVARYWFLEAFAMRRPGTGVAGFSSFGRNEDSGARWSAYPGFLIGSAGIALALIGAASPVLPEWDRLLLASLPLAGTEPTRDR